MADKIFDDLIIQKTIAWGEDKPDVRAMILTSTMAIPGGYRDALSDYDIILIVEDIHPYYKSRDWLEAFGTVLALYRDPILKDENIEHYGYVIQFDGGLKIDFTLWPVAMMQHIAHQAKLPEEFDAGYIVLLDKDGLTTHLQPPTHQGYIPKPPSDARFMEIIENFFLDTTYVAKFLWRDDLMAAKHIFHTELRHECLLPMLVWLVEIENQWTVKPGPYGRRLKKWLRPDLWQDLEQTYIGVSIEENWDNLYKMIALFERVAKEVGAAFGFVYPETMQQQITVHLDRVRHLDPDATQFTYSD